MPVSRRSPEERAPQTGRFVEVAGRRVHLLTKGQGAPFVLLHGNGSLAEEILSAFPEVDGVRWIAPDRPGFGQSHALPDGLEGPLPVALWLGALLDALHLPRVTLVAHSLAAGPALAFAGLRPERVDRLVLLAPFCRPTRERLMPGLRLAAAPVIGRFIRRVIVPPLIRRLRQRIIRTYMAPNRPPPWLVHLPVSHAASPRGVKATAAELKRFNVGMRAVEPLLPLTLPVTVVHGLVDKTANPAWHLPWLRRRLRQMDCVLLHGCGHAVHHAAPDAVLRAVLEAPATAAGITVIPPASTPRKERADHAGQSLRQDPGRPAPLARAG